MVQFSLWVLHPSEICEFQKSLQEKTIMMDFLLLLDSCEVPEWINFLSILIVQVISAVMKKLSGMLLTESIEAMALMRIPTCFLDINADEKEANCRDWFPSPHRVLVLDGVQVILTDLRLCPIYFVKHFNSAYLL
ncbi:hypothetical protein RchiOBHm_Chr6g0269301 [Rosa chinensis]|uniref:Uncharacterized protein n=1 Tax=Rosa chinensis TaxID=74649 RepID=A0A2P6PQE8_ROSCH|nr:hypothetical protein RchiOBHm_Chr6g0269301 [Rosa chinensis]